MTLDNDVNIKNNKKETKMSTKEHAPASTPAGDQVSSDQPITREQFEALQTELIKSNEAKERILGQYKDVREKYQSYQAKEQEALDAQKAQEEERLRKEGNFQILLEQREQKIKELEGTVSEISSKLDSREEAILKAQKANALEEAMGGKLRNKKYYSLVDFDSIAVNPDTGDIDKDSLNQYAGEFIKSHKELVNFGSNGNLPNGTPTGSNGMLTHEQWSKLPLDQRKKRMKDVRL